MSDNEFDDMMEQEEDNGGTELTVVDDGQGTTALSSGDLVRQRKNKWGRSDDDDLSEPPSNEADPLEVIGEWIESLKNDKEIWPSSWHIVDSPASSGWFIDKYGVYLLKGDATIHPDTKDAYSWHCLATPACRRKLMMVSTVVGLRLLCIY